MRDLSQYGEYTLLKNYFIEEIPRHKIIVDVGARGFSLSNSLNFIIDLKWRGLLVEPYKESHLELCKKLKDENVVVVNAAISDYSGDGKLYHHKIAGHHSLLNKTEQYEVCKIYTLPELLKDNSIPEDFDILTVDAEGMDERIIKFMFEKSNYRPRIILHEKNNGKLFSELFIKYSYNLIYETRGNGIYEKRRDK